MQLRLVNAEPYIEKHNTIINLLVIPDVRLAAIVYLGGVDGLNNELVKDTHQLRYGSLLFITKYRSNTCYTKGVIQLG